MTLKKPQGGLKSEKFSALSVITRIIPSSLFILFGVAISAAVKAGDPIFEVFQKIPPKGAADHE